MARSTVLYFLQGLKSIGAANELVSFMAVRFFELWAFGMSGKYA